MTSPFQTTEVLPCSPFETPTSPTRTGLVFYRKTLAQNSAGELIQTWVSAITAVGDLVPTTGKLVRYVHGELREVPYTFTVAGVVDIRATDRCEIPQPFTSGILVEVDNVDFFGTELTDVILKWVR